MKCDTPTPFGAPMRKHFLIDPDFVNLNHGKYYLKKKPSIYLPQYLQCQGPLEHTQALSEQPCEDFKTKLKHARIHLSVIPPQGLLMHPERQ